MRLRLGFLAVSVVAHVIFIMSLSLVLRHLPTRPIEPIAPEVSPLPRYSKVFLPPPAVLQPRPSTAQPVPRPLESAHPVPDSSPTPVPPPPAVQVTPPAPMPTPTPAFDEISIGDPDRLRQRNLLLRREDDLTKQAKGRREALKSGEEIAPRPVAPQAASKATAALEAGTDDARRETQEMKLPSGSGSRPAPQTATRPRLEPPSLAATLRELETRLAQDGGRGITTGTDRGTGPLSFDPQGADFTAWINHWKNEVYRNWIVPPSIMLGGRGHVAIGFTVERDGTLSAIGVLETSGTPAWDRAAQNALLSSRLLPLPEDFGPPRVTIQVRFHYNMPESD